MKKLVERTSGVVGLAHLVSCPKHGLLGLALLCGAGQYLPKKAMDVVKWPHDFATHKMFYPLYDRIIPREEEPAHHMARQIKHSCTDSCGSHNHELATNYRALDLAHLTSTTTGYGSLALYAGFLTAKIVKKRRRKCGCTH